MVCFATPYGLSYATHCFNRADAQNAHQALFPAGRKLGVTSISIFVEPIADSGNRGGKPRALKLYLAKLVRLGTILQSLRPLPETVIWRGLRRIAHIQMSAKIATYG